MSKPFKNLILLPISEATYFTSDISIFIVPIMFVAQHKDLFTTNIQSHNLETRQINNLYTPQANLSTFQKGAYYYGTKIFNKLPSNIKTIRGNITKFKTTLKCLYMNSFYTLEEYCKQ
jgi:hypothetical protein